MRQWYLDLAHQYKERAKTMLASGCPDAWVEALYRKADEYLSLSLDAEEY